jgi:hypothetical protein
MMIYCINTYMYGAVHANRVATPLTMGCCHAHSRLMSHHQGTGAAKGRFPGFSFGMRMSAAAGMLEA